jgi:hypothetical protein
MATTANRSRRDPRTGRFARPVTNVDAESRFDPMADSIEDINDVSAAPSPSTAARPRHAPQADRPALYGPVMQHRQPVMIHAAEMSDDPREARNAALRSAARGGGPMDPTYELVSGFGAESPEQRAEFIERRAQAQGVRDGD